MPAELKTYAQEYTADALGEILLTGPVAVSDFSRASLAITQHPTSVPNIVVRTRMGPGSSAGRAANLDVFPLDAPLRIRSYDVVAPELSVVLTGAPPGAVVSIQAWLFLRP